jgi:hypothetical protein
MLLQSTIDTLLLHCCYTSTQAIKEGRDLPPVEATPAALDDRTECPHCNRKFQADSAKRHIPLCAVKAKLKPKKAVLKK